jgi:hypothetical protein
MAMTLEQFTQNRRDLTTETRKGFNVLPDHEETAQIRRVALAAGVKESALVEVYDCYTGHNGRHTPEFNLGDSMEAWLEEQKAGARPHLFVQPDSYALASQAFNVNGVLNLSARSRLVLEQGEAAAEALALAYGLQPTGAEGKALHDFKTQGKIPEPGAQSVAQDVQKAEAELVALQARLERLRKSQPEPGKGSSNPYDRLKGEALTKWLEGAIVAMGTRKVSEIAAAAHPPRRLDGTVIPEKFR